MNRLSEFRHIGTETARRIFDIKALEWTMRMSMTKTGGAYMRFKRNMCPSYHLPEERREVGQAVGL